MAPQWGGYEPKKAACLRLNDVFINVVLINWATKYTICTNQCHIAIPPQQLNNTRSRGTLSSNDDTMIFFFYTDSVLSDKAWTRGGTG